MRARSVIGFELLMLCLTFCVLGSIGKGEESKSPSGAGVSEGTAQEFSFSLTQVPEDPSRYSLVVSDSDERSISGIFSIGQLQILRAVMAEAEKFSLNSEAAGAKDSVTTRFEDKQESAFIVDVEKTGNQSRLFLTLKTEIGRMTVNAGRVVRSSRREEGFFFDLLTRLEAVLPKPNK